MSQQFHYISPGQWDVDLGTSAARLGAYGGFSMRAETGQIGSSTFILDNPTLTVGHNNDNILGLKSFATLELDCLPVGADGVNGSNLFRGYFKERIYGRGDGSRPSLIVGPAGQITATLEDLNSALAFRVVTSLSKSLAGTVTKNAGNTTITGVGTDFLSSLSGNAGGANFTISIPGGGGTDILYVASVASNTSLTVVTAPTHTASGQAITRIDGDRPAETDVQRVLWAISGSTDYLVNVTNDAGWVDTSGPVAMDANNYLGQTIADVLHDCALASGKNWWVGYWEATRQNSFWYRDSNTATIYSSLLRISNVLADVDGTTTFAPMDNPELRRDPARTFAGVWFPFPAGHSYQTNTTTGSNYAWRDGVAPSANIKTQAKADAEALRLVNDAATEEDRITCRVQLPSTLATGIKHGQRIQCKFSHLPGYTDWSWLRVMSLQVAQDEPTDKRYTLTLEMTPQVFRSCSTALSAIVTAGATNNLAASLPTAGITPTAGASTLLLGVTYGRDTNTPTCSAYVQGAGYTHLDDWDPVAQGAGNTEALVGVEYRSVTAGSYTVDASFTAGFPGPGSADNNWRQVAVAIGTSAASPVQHVIGNVGSSPLASTPTPGNILIGVFAFATALGTLDEAGWTILDNGGGDARSPMIVAARCVQAGDGKSWSATPASRTICALSEWTVT